MKMIVRVFAIALILLCLLPPPEAHAGGVEDALGAFDSDQRLTTANAFFARLDAEEFTESKIVFSADTPADSLRQQVWYWAAEWFYDTQDYRRALDYGVKALPLCNGASEIKADCLNTLACISVRLSDMENAAAYAKRCVDVDMAQGDPDRISSSMNTLVGIYMSAHQTAEAEKIILLAIDYADKANNPPRKAVLLGMAAEIEHSLAHEEKALDYARQAFRIDSAMGRALHAAIRQDQMAAALIGLRRYAEAEAALRRAIPVLREQGNMHSLAIADNHLGTCLIHQHREAEAAPFYGEAARLLARMGDKFNEMYAHRGLCLSLWESDPDSARAEMNRFIFLKDSLYTSESSEAFARLNAEFGNDQLTRENVRMRWARVRDWVLGGAALLVLVLAGLWYYRRMRAATARRIAELIHEIERLNALPADTQAAEMATPAVGTPAQGDADQGDTDFLNRVIDTVNGHLQGGNLSLDFVARQLGLSESTLRRRITAITGDSPKAYIQAIQMQRVCRLLDDGMAVSAVAYECGFSDPSSLTRTFKRVFGVTPTQYHARPLPHADAD